MATLSAGSFTAGEALDKYDVLELGTYPSLDKADADTDRPICITNSAVASGEIISDYTLLSGGIATVRSGAAISAGDNITCTTDGEVKTAAAADVVIGLALEAATDADEYIRALVYQGWLLA